ncbi:MAG: response regulator [Nitrospinae bacterium]|nr:response regulator [Nitrospinota bacterium]MBL7020792.1 response regulator [Nitrospinaceae bacterium]
MQTDNKSLLFIDDEKSILKTLGFFLNKNGFNVDTASSGEEGLKKFKKTHPDIVITDLMMEGISGLEVFEEIMRIDKDVMILVLTGYGSLDSAIEALRNGAFDYLQKPCDRSELLMKILKCSELQDAKSMVKAQHEELAQSNYYLQEEINRRTKVEKDLKHHLDNLDNLINKRTQELREAKNLAEASSRAKSAFLTSMSHELRTPLNAILGFAQLLQMKNQTENFGFQESIEHILKAGDQLLQMVTQILEYASMEKNIPDFKIEPTNLILIVKNVLEQVKPISTKFDVEIITEFNKTANWTILADPQHLHEIVSTLMVNAIQYNKAGGSVKVWLEETQNGNGIRLNILDTGMGISTEDQSQIFVPFSRLSVTGTNIHGAGLGLSMSKRLADLMGGSIGFSSIKGEGSHFYVQFPKAQKTY